MAHPLLTSLAGAADPILLIEPDGSVGWLNDEARRATGMESGSPLRDRVTLATVRALFAIEHHGEVTLHALPKTPRIAPSRAIVIELAGAQPDATAFLLVLKSVAARHRELDALISLTAHDLKNPLGAIFGYADAVLDTSLSNDLSERHRTVLARIRATATRALELVRNFQFLAGHGDREDDPILPSQLRTKTPHDLNPVVTTVVDYSYRDDPQLPTLEVQLAPRPLPVPLDRGSLERIAANLIVNALKYTPRGGRVTVSTEQAAHGALLTVHNTDSWITEEDLPFIFERYRRGANASAAPGSGLGLYIVRRIVEGCGGSIAAESSREHGTTFRVLLPNQSAR